MGVYGYPIDEEELEAAKEKERKKRSGEESEEESFPCDGLAENEDELFLENDEDEEDEEDEDEEEISKKSFSKKKGVLEKIKNYIFCTEPSLMAKMKILLKKEDFEYLRKDFFWYVVFTIVPFFVGMFLAIIMFNSGENDALLFAVVFFCFGGSVVTNLWKGRVWYYVKRSVSNRKMPITPEELALMIPKFRKKEEDVPIRKLDIALFFAATTIAVALVFM